MSHTTHIERTVERYDEDTDTYEEDDIICTVLVHPAEPDVGIMLPYAEIDMVECDDRPYQHELSAIDKQAVECEALESLSDYMRTPRHLRHRLADL